jgi:hypothetical protein
MSLSNGNIVLLLCTGFGTSEVYFSPMEKGGEKEII